MSLAKPKTLKLDEQKLMALIKFAPHSKQQEVLAASTRFTTLCWGRRSGKTYLVAYLALKKLLTSNNNVWIVAPTYDLAKRSWDYLTLWVQIINKSMGHFIKINKSNYSMESYSNSRLELKSADNPSSLLGIGLNLLIIDEAARIPEDIWRTYLRPTLSDRMGKAVFISTPCQVKGDSTSPLHTPSSLATQWSPISENSH
jgi:phage terminase large subunit-like protein